MAIGVGDAVIPVLPDMSTFQRDVRRAVDRVMRRLDVADFRLGVDVDAGSVEQQLERLATDHDIDLNLELDDAGIRSQLERLSDDQLARVSLDLDDANVRSQIDRIAADRRLTIRADVDIDDADLDAIGESAGRDLSSGIADGIGQVTAGGVAGVVGGIVAAAVGGVAEALDRNAIRDRFAARLGLTADEAERYGDQAGEAYKSAWGESLEGLYDTLAEVDEQVADLATFGEAELFGAVTAAEDFASVFEVDVAENLKAVGQLVRNDLVGSVEEAFDFLAVGFQNSADRGDDFIDSIAEYSAFFRELGFDAQDIMATFTGPLEAGVWNTDRIADGFKELVLKVDEGGDEVRTTVDAIGLDFDQLQRDMAAGGDAGRDAVFDIVEALAALGDTAEAEAAGVALMGTPFEDLRSEGIAAILEAQGAVGAFGGTMDEVTREANDNLQTRLISGWRTFTSLLPDWLDGNVLPAVERVLNAMDEDGLAGAVDQVRVEWETAWPAIEAWLEETIVPALRTLGEKAGEALGDGLIESVRASLPSITELLMSVGRETTPGLAFVGNVVDKVAGAVSGGGGGGGSTQGSGSIPRPTGSSSGGGGGGSTPRSAFADQVSDTLDRNTTSTTDSRSYATEETTINVTGRDAERTAAAVAHELRIARLSRGPRPAMAAG